MNRIRSSNSIINFRSVKRNFLGRIVLVQQEILNILLDLHYSYSNVGNILHESNTLFQFHYQFPICKEKFFGAYCSCAARNSKYSTGFALFLLKRWEYSS